VSDPRRLLDGDATDDERELLGTWQDEAPSPRARRAVLGLLAAGTASAATATGAAATATGATATATATVAAATATGTAATAATAAGAAATGLGGIFKAMIFGALCGVFTLGVVEIATPSSPAPPAVSSLVAAAAPAASGIPGTGHRAAAGDVARVDARPLAAEVPSPRSSAPAPVAPATLPALAPSDAPPSEPEVAPDAPGAGPEPAPAPAPRADLSGEIASIDGVRSALGAGAAAQALARLDAHDAAFGGGALAQEATLLRIQALVKLGRRGEAVALGRAFVTAHPTSTHATRVRAIVPEIRAGEGD
jgi:hypothetical protein